MAKITQSDIKHLVKLQKNRRYRYSCRSVIIEGNKLVNEVCETLEAKKLLLLEGTSIPKKARAKQVFHVNESLIERIAGSKTPEGILAEVPMPEAPTLQGIESLLVLDQLNDPGNIGTLFRTACAFGWDGIFLVEPSCDPYNDKALRAAKGATFRIPHRTGSWSELKALIEKENLVTFGADLEGTPLGETKIPKKTALILGSEAHGLSREAVQLCQKITIPMNDNTESLNVAVAGGILMHYFQQR